MLVLTSTFPRWEGDTEPRFVLDLCRHLSDTAEILVLAPHAPGAEIEESIYGVRVNRYRYFFPERQALTYNGGIVGRIREKPWRAIQLPGLIFFLYRAIVRATRDWQPQLIHAHWIIPQGFVACLAVRGRIPVVCTSHGGDLFGLQSGLLKQIKSWTLKRCRRITVVSESMVIPVRRLAPHASIDVIPMGTETGKVFVPPRDPRYRRDNEIVFVGRLVEKKGVRHLIDAVKQLRGAGADVTLRIVGDGPLRQELERQVDVAGLMNRVSFAGSVPHSSLPEVYQRAAIAAFPFVVAEGGDQEGFGLVVSEAMACGCPVVSSDLPAIREHVDPGVTGVLVPPEDAGELAKAIEDLLGRRETRAALSKAALHRVREKFDWRCIAARYNEVIEESLGG